MCYLFQTPHPDHAFIITPSSCVSEVSLSNLMESRNVLEASPPEPLVRNCSMQVRSSIMNANQPRDASVIGISVYPLLINSNQYATLLGLVVEPVNENSAFIRLKCLEGK